MRVLFLIFLAVALTPRAARAGDSEGCADLKLFPRLEGCVIVECSAKHHDTFDAGSGALLNPWDADTNALSYSCPVGDLQKMEHDFDGQLRKAGYLNITADLKDAASPALTARKGAQWIHWNANTEDGTTSYTLTTASGAGDKFKAEACAQPPVFSAFKQCEVEECASKSEDSVAIRVAHKEQTSLTGNVETVTLACPSVSPAQAFATTEGELKQSGFEIVFSDREHPESSWVTARTGRRWVELASSPEGGSVSYVLTVVPSAEVLSAAAPEPAVAEPKVTVAALPVPEPAPAPAPAPIRVEAALAVREPLPVPALPVPTIQAAPAAAPVAAARPLVVGFVPPKPILQVPIEATSERIYSVVGDIVINILVDVGEDGSVSNPVLTGRITKDVQKLESAALEAVLHWRFEPARQDGRAVPAVKFAVKMRFHGRPWRS
jgi:hypothetical protein